MFTGTTQQLQSTSAQNTPASSSSNNTAGAPQQSHSVVIPIPIRAECTHTPMPTPSALMTLQQFLLQASLANAQRVFHLLSPAARTLILLIQQNNNMLQPSFSPMSGYPLAQNQAPTHPQAFSPNSNMQSFVPIGATPQTNGNFAASQPPSSSSQSHVSSSSSPSGAPLFRAL